ncbi:MAG: DUF4198 domain-containing protein [Proteobacteria bacterium]|nr:DUF4198 domain-containing protein [Pseudomonadota bacterium]
MRRFLPLLLVLLLLPAAALAHDYWLEGTADGAITVRMWVGDSFHKGEEKAYSKRKAGSLVRVSAAGTVDLKPSVDNGVTPVVTFTPEGDGGHLVATTRTASKVSLPGWKFSTYLSHEKFDHVSAARKAAGTSWDEGRERYTRYLKTLVQVGTKGDEVYGTVLDHRFEIVPLNDPSFVSAGDPLVIRVLFEGKPQPGVRAVARSKSKEEVEAITDANGVARLVLPSADIWNARAVYIRACTGCDDADWESFWASYQFANTR